ncbi:MAG TPA: hypothetical protein VM260_05450 [Pirellula sp.]|nr:hypothetical protein [Pirellula sp.]
MYKLLTSKRLQKFVLLGFLAVSAKSVDAGRSGTATCDATSPLGMIERPDFPREFSNFPTPFQPESSGSPSPVSEPTSSGSGRGGGFGDLNLISGSRGGDSFAAMAPGTYIDNAVISNMFRFRVDSGYNNSLPDRAEFFYGQCGCFGGNAPGPGSPPGGGNPGIANGNVDFQEFVPYFERVVSGNFSMFAETPFRLINPDVTDNTGGLSDINAGIKASLLSCNHQYLTAQFRVYAPTGDARRGLGNGHASLEPGLLYLSRRNDRLILQSEFRVWIPLSDSRTQDGRNFAGTILRYGMGGGYDLLNLDTGSQRRRLTGTFETVGWSITSGQAFDANTGNVLNAAGDTIVNIKSGLRYTAGRRSIAASYGKPITGDRWYSDLMRVEYRYAY